VFVTVTPQADPGKRVQATITILGGTGISLSPITQTIAANQRFILSASVSGLADTTLNWSVNGIAGGNTTFGQICAAGSRPCQVATSSSASQVEYLRERFPRPIRFRSSPGAPAIPRWALRRK
jgi:hypothetical protein